MKYQIKIILSLIGLISPSLISCQEPPTNLTLAYGDSGESKGYYLNDPDHNYKLPGILEEVSGLTWLGNGQVGCVQDEDGVFYVYDLNKEEIVAKNKFGEPGDYEGVQMVEDVIYVVKSNGDLYHFEQEPGEVRVDRKKEKLPFKAKNDIEGLGYSTSQKKLLVALKGNSGLDGEDKKGKRVYLLDRKTFKVNKKAFLTIRLKDLQEKVKMEGKELKIKEFRPSAIAEHPITKDIYVVASAGKAVVVYSAQAEFKSIFLLDKKVHRQPEGICFAQDGTLYLSNEGGGEKGYILQFDYKKQ